MEIPTASSQSIRFGEFELDLRTAELRTNGHKFYLQEKPFQVLALLVERPGQLVTRDELRDRLWPSDTFVDFDQSLNKAVNRLREALEDSTEHPRFVETVPRRGYRFIASVTSGPQEPASDSSLEAVTVPSPQVPLAGRNWKRLAGILAVVLSVMVVVGIAVPRWRSRSRSFNLEKMEITKLTDSGKAESVAISPDGRYVVYALRDRQGLGLWIQQVATHRDVQILPSDAIDFDGLTFSPDGNYIYFVRAAKNDRGFKYLYVMPVLGGPARLLATDIDSPVSFSPEGRQFVYTRGDPPRNVSEVRIANADGSGNRLLATMPETLGGGPGAAWSPDGRTIAVSCWLDGKRSGYVLDLVSIADGSLRELYSSSYFIGRPLWLPEGDALLVSLQDRTGRGQLWRISYPQGQTRRLTNDLADYGAEIDATRDAGTVAAIQSNQVSNIWVAPATDPSGGRQITSGELPMLEVAAAPQGKLVAASSEGELWTMNLDGSHATPLPDVHNARNPASCGGFLIFDSLQPGKEGLMRADADGSNPTMLAQGQIWSPVCSTDQQSIFYFEIGRPWKIWRTRVGGGVPTEVATVLGAAPVGRLNVSPDGKSLAYAFEEYTPEPVTKLAVIPADGSHTARLLKAPGGIYKYLSLRWSPDGKSMQFLLAGNGATNIWEQPLAGGEPKQVTKFTSGQIFGFNWFPDGKQLLLSRGDISSDVVLLSNFR